MMTGRGELQSNADSKTTWWDTTSMNNVAFVTGKEGNNVEKSIPIQ
jgi:hypothetical protein